MMLNTTSTTYKIMNRACPASAGGKTTGGCFLCVPETEFRQGTKKRQNKGSIYLCPEPGTVSACVSKANQLKPYEYFSRYLGSTGSFCT